MRKCLVLCGITLAVVAAMLGYGAFKLPRDAPYANASPEFEMHGSFGWKFATHQWDGRRGDPYIRLVTNFSGGGDLGDPQLRVSVTDDQGRSDTVLLSRDDLQYGAAVVERCRIGTTTTVRVEVVSEDDLLDVGCLYLSGGRDADIAETRSAYQGLLAIACIGASLAAGAAFWAALRRDRTSSRARS